MRSVLAAMMLMLALPGAALAQTSGVEDCKPGGVCDHPLPVRMVLVTLFEIGADTGDKPAEFQLWKERRHFDVRIPFPQSYHDLYYDPATQTLAMVTGIGNIRSATAVMALGLDQRFDLSKAYWLVAGIAGIDPQDASIGSAAWAGYLIDGDLAHEIDPREIPKDWKYGYFPRDKKGPNDKSTPDASGGEMFELNLGLREWAYELTKGVAIPDDPGVAKARSKFTGYPNAQKPPFVLKGDQLAALTFWHGKLMTGWANDWVHYWTGGRGEFVTSAMEETGSYTAIQYLDRIGRADKNRYMVLRAGSNYTMPPPGIAAADYLLAENEGYAGMTVALESLYRVGSKVIDEITGHWDKYEKAPPK
ncbi:MAG: purine nucleoside permease [Sphingobium sp.]|nr:purine nucleoside permease [Sphingobium sp.]